MLHHSRSACVALSRPDRYVDYPCYRHYVFAFWGVCYSGIPTCMQKYIGLYHHRYGGEDYIEGQTHIPACWGGQYHSWSIARDISCCVRGNLDVYHGRDPHTWRAQPVYVVV